MQKFIRLFIILIFFFACLFAGVYLAGFTNTDAQLPLNSIDIENSNQVNFLVFVVNQLDEKKPDFHSAWSVIFYYPNPKGIVLVPLNSNSENKNNELSRNFKLDSQNFPTKKTIKFNEDKFNAQWDAVIVMDLHAAQYALNWLSNETFSIETSLQNNQSFSLENINNTSISLCKYLSNHQLPEWDKLNINGIGQNHFQSNLSDESMAYLWAVMHDEHPPKCEVIQLEKKQN